MATLGGFYLNPHRSQFDGSPLANENCTPTSAANGANAATGGHVNKTGGQVRALLPRAQETNPATPGWSIEDADHAMAKIGVPYSVRSGAGWSGVTAAWAAGLYVDLQGESWVFSNSTCSGDFNGAHCIGGHPATRLVNGLRQHWIDDPICKTGRWEYDYILRRYATQLAPNIWFGVFTHPVPHTAPPAVTVTLRYGGVKLTPAQAKRIDVPSGQKANIRLQPSHLSALEGTLASGTIWTAFQRTTTGELLAGSRIWYGDRTGTRWLHITAF